MKKSDIYEVAIKILGIYLFFNSFGLLREFFYTVMLLVEINNEPEIYSDFSPMLIFLMSVVDLGLVVFIAYLLTFKTKSVVKLVCRSTDYEESASMLADRKNLYELAIMVMGLIIIMWTVPDFSIKLKAYVSMVQRDIPTRNYDTNFLISSLIKIGLGIAAVVYAKSISSALDKKNKP